MLMVSKIIVVELIILSPEYPSTLPPKLWLDIKEAVIKDNPMFFVALLKRTCRQTKLGIIRRVVKPETK